MASHFTHAHSYCIYIQVVIFYYSQWGPVTTTRSETWSTDVQVSREEVLISNQYS